MNVSEWSAVLNGREYGEELNNYEVATAKGNGIVIVFGYSDDNMELRGAINDEVGCWDGGAAYLTDKGIFRPCACGEDCQSCEEAKENCYSIEAVCGKQGYSWTYVADFEHETFDIMEDGEKYCKGIVFHISSLKG